MEQASLLLGGQRPPRRENSRSELSGRPPSGRVFQVGIAVGLRRTPCVGICSTTYGDLVCRGCKRFAHEIVGWNGYRDGQRDLVWARLNRLLADSVRVFVAVVDEERLRAAAGIGAADEVGVELLAYRALRRAPESWAALGLRANRHLIELQADSAQGVGEPGGDGVATAAAALQAIDREFYLRSCGAYEHSFKVRI